MDNKDLVCLNDTFDLSDIVVSNQRVFIPRTSLPRFQTLYRNYREAQDICEDAVADLNVLKQKEQEAKSKVEEQAVRDGVELVYNSNAENNERHVNFSFDKGWWIVIGSAGVTALTALIKALIQAHADAAEHRKNQELLVAKRQQVAAREAAFVEAFLQHEAVADSSNYNYSQLLRHPVVKRANVVLGKNITRAILRDTKNFALERLEEIMSNKKDNILGVRND